MSKRRKMNKKGKRVLLLIGLFLIIGICVYIALNPKKEEKPIKKKIKKPKVEEKLKIVDLKSTSRP